MRNIVFEKAENGKSTRITIAFPDRASKEQGMAFVAANLPGFTKVTTAEGNAPVIVCDERTNEVPAAGGVFDNSAAPVQKESDGAALLKNAFKNLEEGEDEEDEGDGSGL